MSSQVANPVMVVDEVDKAGTLDSVGGRSTSLTTSLLPLLDSGTAERFECPYHRLSFDMSRVVWIMTANDPDQIPAPLRDRSRVFHLPRLSVDDAIAHFDRLTLGDDDPFGRADCREFIARTAARPRGISLRQVRQLADACRAPTVSIGH